MFCPHCKSADHRVVDTRGAGDGIRRRRECHQCGGRFTTYEQGEQFSQGFRKLAAAMVGQFR